VSYRSTAAKVRQAKEAHPELYCPNARCLWRTGGGHCPRHETAAEAAEQLSRDERHHDDLVDAAHDKAEGL
jgi:hypothetical protein